jgi:hypothetical protein
MARPNRTGIQIIDPGIEPISAESESPTQHSQDAYANGTSGSSYSVVFVHGLQGDPVETWSLKPLSSMQSSLPNLNFFRSLTSRQQPRDKGDSTETAKNTSNRSTTFWPKDLLADDLPNVRLLTFGYSSDVLATFRAVSQNNIMQHAQNLVGDILGERQVGKYTSVSASAEV